MRVAQIPVYLQTEPNLSSGYILNDGPQWFGVIVPEATRNVHKNPSFEVDTSEWTATSNGSTGTPFQRIIDQGYKGSCCAQITIRPTGGSFVQIVDSITLVSGATWAASYHVKCAARALTLADVQLSVGGSLFPFTSLEYCDDGWWRVTAVFIAPSSGSVDVGIRILGTPGAIFYVDACQLENKAYATTYCDGDVTSLTSSRTGEFYWEGTPHLSESGRNARCRSGGKVVNFETLEFRIVAVQGLGLGPVTNNIIDNSALDGGQFQRAKLGQRSFTLSGRVYGATPSQVRRNVRELEAVLAPLTDRRDEQLMLVAQLREGDSYTSSKLLVPCVYSGGLDGNTSGLYGDEFAIQFTQPLPYLFADKDVGKVITGSVPSTNVMVYRKTQDGPWSVLATGTGTVVRMLKGDDGFLYVCGTFTSINGVTANNVARYSDATGWVPLLNGANNGVNAGCTDLCAFPTGEVLFVGSFTTAGGAAATGVAIFTPATSVLSAVTGITGGTPTTCSIEPSARFAVIGGTFTTPSTAICHVTRTGTVSAGVAFATGTPRVVRGSFNRDIYILNTAGAIYRYNIALSSYTLIATTSGSQRIHIGDDGFLYAAGSMTSIDSTSVNYVGKWTGTKWIDAGSGVLDALSNVADMANNRDKGITAICVDSIGSGSYSPGLRQIGNVWRRIDMIRVGQNALSWASDQVYDYFGVWGAGYNPYIGDAATFSIDSVEGAFLKVYLSTTGVGSLGNVEKVASFRISDNLDMQFDQLPVSIIPETTQLLLLPPKYDVISTAFGPTFGKVNTLSEVGSMKLPKGTSNTILLATRTDFPVTARVVAIRAYQSLSEVIL